MKAELLRLRDFVNGNYPEERWEETEYDYGYEEGQKNLQHHVLRMIDEILSNHAEEEV